MSKEGTSRVFNYLNDYLILDRLGSKECLNNITSMLATCNKVGISVEVDKCLGHRI